MGEDEQSVTQLTFRDGELVEASASQGPPHRNREDPAEPGDRTGYDVAAKPGALEVNSALVDAVESHGEPLTFGSRRAAERYAAQLSVDDGALRLQAVAPNDPAGVDGYLLADHDPAISEPASVDGDTWVFDIGANLYGVLGEALLLEAPKPHALYYFVRQDLDREERSLEAELHLDVSRGTPITVTETEDGAGQTWVPDCVIVAKDGWDGPVLATYYCEIKTGNASFERDQRAAMERLATEERVLTIRVLIESLPDQYSVRIRALDP